MFQIEQLAKSTLALGVSTVVDSVAARTSRFNSFQQRDVSVVRSPGIAILAISKLLKFWDQVSNGAYPGSFPLNKSFNPAAGHRTPT